MPRKRVPVVGTNQLNVAQLSPEVRRILAHRARQAARREYAPVLQADRGAFGTAKQEYRSQAQSARGATSAVESILAQALGGLKGSGLSGTALQQTKGEFTSRAADAASALPALLAEAGEDRSKAIGEARQNLLGDRAAMQQSKASKFNSLLESERSKASTVLGEQDESGNKSPLSSDPRSLKNAFVTAQVGIKELLGNAGKWVDEDGNLVDPGTEGATEIHPPRNDAEWRAFATQVSSEAEGADETDAINAVAILRKRIERQMHQGKLPQPGVPRPR